MSGQPVTWLDLVGERVRLRGAHLLEDTGDPLTLTGKLLSVSGPVVVIEDDRGDMTFSALATPDLSVDRWTGGRGPYVLGGILAGAGAGGAVGYLLIDEGCTGPGFSCLGSAVSGVISTVAIGAVVGGILGGKLAKSRGRRGWVPVRPAVDPPSPRF